MELGARELHEETERGGKDIGRKELAEGGALLELGARELHEETE